MDNSLTPALIAFLDNYNKYNKFNSYQEVETSIVSYYEEFWEQNFELHEQNQQKFDEACSKVKNLTQEYIVEKNLKF